MYLLSVVDLIKVENDEKIYDTYRKQKLTTCINIIIYGYIK